MPDTLYVPCNFIIVTIWPADILDPPFPFYVNKRKINSSESSFTQNDAVGQRLNLKVGL